MVFNRVSDDDYFRDLSNLISITSLTHLNREAWLTTQHANWHAELRAQSYQTLQDSTSTIHILEPYARLPQARLGMTKTFGNGLEFKLDSEATRFAHPTQTEGTRALAYPTLRLPLTNSFGFFTPQIGWHSSYYDLDDSVDKQRISRNLPILSLDSGVTFDRPFRLPATISSRRWSRAPTMYTLSIATGCDPGVRHCAARFPATRDVHREQVHRRRPRQRRQPADARRHQPLHRGRMRTGAPEVTLGQRYYFSAQQVSLPDVPPRTSSATDLLAAISGQITRDWRIDTAWQYDTQNGTTIRQNLGASYRPGPGRALNFGYRFLDQATGRTIVSAQWPLASAGTACSLQYRPGIKLVDRAGPGLNTMAAAGRCAACSSAWPRGRPVHRCVFHPSRLSAWGRWAQPARRFETKCSGYSPSNEIFKRPEWRLQHWALAWLIAASTLLPAYAAFSPLDHIVAVVNDEGITRQELVKRYDEVVRNLSRQNTPLPSREILEKQLLERMVTELALQQHARSTGVRVDPTQVERALQRIAAQNKLDMAGLAAALEKDGQSLDHMRTTIRNEILIARARERDVDNRIAVSDAEIEGYLQTQAQQGVETEYNFAHILVTVPENASPEQIQARRDRAEDILAQLPGAPISPSCRPAIPMPPMRCRAALSAGAPAVRCRPCSPMR